MWCMWPPSGLAYLLLWEAKTWPSITALGCWDVQKWPAQTWNRQCDSMGNLDHWSLMLYAAVCHACYTYPEASWWHALRPLRQEKHSEKRRGGIKSVWVKGSDAHSSAMNVCALGSIRCSGMQLGKQIIFHSYGLLCCWSATSQQRKSEGKQSLIQCCT